MQGAPGRITEGIIPRAVSLLLERVAKDAAEWESRVTMSYLELYNDKLLDLLAAEPQPSG